jgi:hypothetical protein
LSNKQGTLSYKGEVIIDNEKMLLDGLGILEQDGFEPEEEVKI